ncbi:MAG: enoyl-CoA hydratase/isomerase family protein [Myxococcales bacterium]|nr:enoyl-CoA hydratase/isomerase family protein [Myxococcales bacterium]
MSGILVERLEEGRIARLSLSAGKGNVLTKALNGELARAFDALGEDRRLRAIVLTAEGKDFSFGASVPEHAPGQVEQMLPAFHALFRSIARSALPVVAAVRGRCLGGGFELALAAHRIFVTPDAKLGVPEVTLGVFPPVAAALLPLRVPQPVVDRMVGLGEIVDGSLAVQLGLADTLVEAPEALESEALDWARRTLDLSGAAVRFATRAARAAWDEALGSRLAQLEALYLNELMETADAREGIAAFIERRKPRWVDA